MSSLWIKVSKKLLTSFLIGCSKVFYDGAWLNSASVGSWVIRFVWWRSFPRNAWRVEWNSRRTSAGLCHSPSSAGAWSAAKGPYPFWSSFFHRQSRGPYQKWSPPLARANIEIFFSDERADFGLWWACWEWLGKLWPTSERPSCDGSWEPCRSLPSPSLRDRADRPAAWGRSLCLFLVFERSVSRLSNGNVGHPDWCHSE